MLDLNQIITVLAQSDFLLSGNSGGVNHYYRYSILATEAGVAVGDDNTHCAERLEGRDVNQNQQPIIDLHTPEGQQLLQEVRETRGPLQPALLTIFEKYAASASCGVQV